MAGPLGHPFESIESAQEYIELLSQVAAEARLEIEAECSRANAAGARGEQALLLVLHKLKTLDFHLQKSQRALNDLRTLRRLLNGEVAEHSIEFALAASGTATTDGHE